MSITNTTIKTTNNGTHEQLLSQNKVMKPTITDTSGCVHETKNQTTPNTTQGNYKPYTKIEITTRIGDSPPKTNANIDYSPDHPRQRHCKS